MENPEDRPHATNAIRSLPDNYARPAPTVHHVRRYLGYYRRTVVAGRDSRRARRPLKDSGRLHRRSNKDSPNRTPASSRYMHYLSSSAATARSDRRHSSSCRARRRLLYYRRQPLTSIDRSLSHPMPLRLIMRAWHYLLCERYYSRRGNQWSHATDWSRATVPFTEVETTSSRDRRPRQDCLTSSYICQADCRMNIESCSVLTISTDWTSLQYWLSRNGIVFYMSAPSIL